MTKFVTTKDLAADMEMDERTFRSPKKQRELGLDAALDRTCKKPIRFNRDKARAALARLGHVAGF
jgi:hypothetical protein